MTYLETRVHDVHHTDHRPRHLTAWTQPDGDIALTVRSNGAASIVLTRADAHRLAAWLLDIPTEVTP